MKFSIFVICYLLLPTVHPSIKTASSIIDIWPLGTTFQPPNSIELLSTSTTRSFSNCANACNFNVQCRTFVYDTISKQCTLYESDISTGKVLTNSSTTQIGSIKYFADLYNCYNKTNDQCPFDRYLVADDSTNVGVCPINTYWNGTMCLNQVYFGTLCTSDKMCRSDMALECINITNQTCGGGYDSNLVRNGDAEIGSCERSVGGVSPAFWTSTGLLTQLEYNNSVGAVFPSSPGPSDRGYCYFWGGAGSCVDMYQTINLNIYSSAIDQYKVSYNFSGWLGGWKYQDDAASLWINFYDSNNVILTNVTISAVHAADRMNISKLLYRQMTGMVPANTRSVTIYVQMISNGRPKYPALFKLVKNIFIIFHGNTDVERGFSINENIVAPNRSLLSELLINGLRTTYDAVKFAGDDFVPIDKELIKAVQNSYSFYKDELTIAEAAVERMEKGREERENADEMYKQVLKQEEDLLIKQKELQRQQ